MKYSLRKLAALSLSAVMTLGLGQAAFAAEEPAANEIKVVVDGAAVSFTDAVPMLQDGRTYVPYRAVLEAMGAKVGFEKFEGKDAVIFQTEDTFARAVIGQTGITLQKDGVASTVETDAAPFVENGRTFVPARFVAEALGYQVGWDAEEKTVVIVDTDAIVAAYADKFTVLDKYVAYTKAFNEKNYMVEGTFTADMTMAPTGEAVELSGIAIDGKMTGLMAGNTGELGMNMSMDTIPSMESMMTKEELADPATQEMLAMMKDMKFNFIMDMDQGKMYMQAPMLKTILGTDEDTWFMMDLASFYSMAGMDGAGLMSSITDLTKAESTAAYMEFFMQMADLNDADAYAQVVALAEMAVKHLGDDAFTKEGSKYVASGDINEADMKLNYSITLYTNGEKVNAYAMNLTMDMGDAGKVVVKTDLTPSGKSTASIQMGVAGLMTMDMKMNMTYTATSKTPITAPAEGAHVVDIMELLMGNLSVPEVAGNATEVTVVEVAEPAAVVEPAAE